VTFAPLAKSYGVRRGGSILRAAIRAHVSLARSCRGDAVCAACKVQVLTGQENLAPPTPAEQGLMERHPVRPDERYACQACVLGDVTVTTRYW
jgi:2Fe-2S ferredoxin